MKHNFTKFFALVALSICSLTVWSATTNDLKTISTDYVFISDDFTANGTTGWSKNTLYDGNVILACGSGGNSVATNKGSVTFEGESHLNSLRLKNEQDMLAIKVSGACTLTFYTQSRSDRGVTVGTTVRSGNTGTDSGCDEYGQQTASTTEWSCNVTSAGFVYIASYGGDFYIAGFKVTFAKTGQPAINTLPVNVKYRLNEAASALTINATAADEGELSYQWYKNTTNRSVLSIEGAEAIDGATSASFTPATTAIGTTYYFCKVTEAGNANVAVSRICAVTVEDISFTVTFSKGETEALGTVPEEVTVSSLTIPVNRTLYKAGYSLTGWNDGTTTYAIGATLVPESDVTITPVFTANTKTLDESLTDLTVRWDFQRKNGAPNVEWQNRAEDFLITQVSINGVNTDVKLDINTNPGKFNNTSWNEWCQVNEGTTFTFPALTGSTVSVYTYNAPTNEKPVGTVDGATHTSVSGNVATYAVSSTSGSSDFVANANGTYYRYIEVTYPAAEVVLPLKSLIVNGEAVDGEILAAINNAPDYEATFSTNVYTTVPTVVATFADDSQLTGVATGTGTSRTYTFEKTLAEVAYTFTFNVEGIYVYTPTGDEEAVAIKMNEGSVESNVWTNGVYTLTTSGIGSSGGADFKFDANTDEPYTIAVPADVVVKQFIIRNFHANYSGGNGQLKTVTSTGATTYLPTRRTALCNVIGGPDNRQYEGEAYDLVVTIENHVAGTPIVFTMLKSAQPMGWIELTTVKADPGTAPEKTAASVTTDDNHAVVAVTFDREIVNDVDATINAKTVKAKGGSTTLYFPVWDLAYATNYTLTIAAGAAEDVYGNKTDAAIEIVVNIPAKTAVVPAEYDYVVSNATELLAAFAAVEATNKDNKNAARKTIFLKNGDYDFGSSAETVCWVRAHNLSLIGESRDGVIIHGNSADISNPVLNLRYWQGYYLQDLTVRNDRDYGTGDFKGVAVAVYGGDKTIMKNVRMLSNQDTQVTGHRVYYEDCAIHGTVDFICGGGDNYYYHTDLVLENRGGNIIVAPSTSSAHQWGYVFDHCTIKAVDDAAAATNAGSYYLGRPWQNEPRAYYLHTTMEVQGATAGWTTMSNLPTHFLEYDSRDALGVAIDLSGRTNSPSSTNHYSPILTADSAAMFTSRNVLGGTDAWDAASKAAQMSAPSVTLADNVLSWDAMDDALLYVVLKDGAYLANTTGTSYNLTESGTYTVKAANPFGGLGTASDAKIYDAPPSAISNTNADAKAVKVLRNGQVVIIRDGKEYNVLGIVTK